MFALIMAVPVVAQRDTISLNDSWQFHRFSEVEKLPTSFAGLKFEETICLPHDFQISQPWIAPSPEEKGDATNAAANIKSRLSARGFKELTKGIYRRTIIPLAAWRNKRVLLDFGGIMLVGDVYLNGQHIGKTDYGYLGFECDITDKLIYDKPNEIIVTAETQGPRNSRWYTGGGLYRGVRIIVTDKQNHFNRHPLYITTQENRKVNIQADFCYMENVDTVCMGVRILDAKGCVVNNDKFNLRYYKNWRSHEYRLPAITLAAPQLWDTDHPYLYTAEVTLYNSKGDVLDCVSDRFGVRTIEFGPAFGFRLNGKKVLLKGNANHHTLGALGAAAYPRAIEKRIRLLKSFGFNHIRCSHNPYSEDFYRLCDEYGILVVDELYDKWLKQYSGGRVDWTLQWQNDITEWVKRDRNHPSIILWSLGNELQQEAGMANNDWGVTNYQLLKTQLHRYDSSRLTTVAMHPRYRSLETNAVPSPLAIATEVNAYNYRYMYFPGDSKLYPKKIFYQSEASTSAMGSNFFEMALDSVVGLAYWGSIDYIGESNGWPAKGWSQGSFDISLQPKPIAYLLKSMFSADPMVHIAVVEEGKATRWWNGVNVGTSFLSENWNRIAGSKVNLHIFTNTEEVTLLLNGKTIARKSNSLDPKKRNKITFNDVAYMPGTIEAVAYNGHKVVARHHLETTNKAERLRLVPDKQTWKADGVDLQHVLVEVVDNKGRRILNDNRQVIFSVAGNAHLVGVSNGDICYNDSFAGQKIRLFQGSAMVILRAGKTVGKVTLQAMAEGLKAVSIKLM